MDATLEVLPGEGDIETQTKVRKRKSCDYCREPAHYKHSFLLENYRTNPASTAYGKDDCTWCSDCDVYTCHGCMPETPERYDSGPTTFPASAMFAHMFLEWVQSVDDAHADDDELATIDWLVSQGGELGTAPVGNRYVDFLVFDDGDGFRQWLRMHEPDSDGSIVPDLFTKAPTGRAAGMGLTGKWPKTRAEVRILFEALGVKLK